MQTKIGNTIKKLLNKVDPLLEKKINKNDYLEPLLFIYFNSKKDGLFQKEILTEILQGYFIKEERLIYSNLINKKGVAYIPNIGYLKDERIEKSTIIKNIEIVKYPIDLLDYIFKNASNNKIGVYDVNIDSELFNKNISFLTNAITFIEKSSKKHYDLIEQNCKKIVLFKTNPSNTNSFTTITAHGMAFLNVYQDDYDEVFFVDDVAHQTGHIIFNTLLFDNEKFFVLDENQNVEDILKQKDHRTVKVLVHALYTYYTTFICLDNCISENLFNNKQKEEAIARIGFYLHKCNSDLQRMEKIINLHTNIENVFGDEGIQFYSNIENEFISILSKWKKIIKYYDYSNQPYNFENSKFVLLNKNNL